MKIAKNIITFVGTSTDIEVTTCYRNSSIDRLYLSWHDVLSGTVRPVEFTYKVTIKYVK